MVEPARDGGCDGRYEPDACFWGASEDALARAVARHVELADAAVLDVGCGDGRNAVFFAAQGARVTALDVSARAIAIAAARDGAAPVHWLVADVRDVALAPSSFEVVFACSALQWLTSREEIDAVLERLRRVTRPGGLVALSAFNARRPYPRLAIDTRDPCLVPHAWYLDRFAGWRLLESADADLVESHADGRGRHVHAFTHLVARRPPAEEA